MNIGIMGAGPIVEAFLQTAEKIDTVNVTAICIREKSKNRAEELSAKYNINRQYVDYMQMIRDPEIDFVYIALPNKLHFEFAEIALKNNINVLLEKPATLYTSELKELARLAKENSLFLFECITTIHLPNFQDIKKRLYEIGTIHTVEANYTQYSSRFDKLKQGMVTNIFNPAMGGGALMDINEYNVHFAVGLWGEPESVYYYPNMMNDIDTSGILLLKYKHFLCSCIGAKDSHGKSHVAIHGENGYIYMRTAPNECKSYEIKTASGIETVNLQKQDDRLYYELCNFSDIYDKRDYSSRDLFLKHSMHVVNVMEKARKAAGLNF